MNEKTIQIALERIESEIHYSGNKTTITLDMETAKVILIMVRRYRQIYNMLHLIMKDQKPNLKVVK